MKIFTRGNENDKILKTVTSKSSSRFYLYGNDSMSNKTNSFERQKEKRSEMRDYDRGSIPKFA